VIDDAGFFCGADLIVIGPYDQAGRDGVDTNVSSKVTA
jgi:hypothetical protein